MEVFTFGQFARSLGKVNNCIWYFTSYILFCNIYSVASTNRGRYSVVFGLSVRMKFVSVKMSMVGVLFTESWFLFALTASVLITNRPVVPRVTLVSYHISQGRKVPSSCSLRQRRTSLLEFQINDEHSSTWSNGSILRCKDTGF